MSTKKDNPAEVLKKKLFHERRNVWDTVPQNELENLEQFASDYSAFLDASKTEREAVINAVQLLESHGFEDIHTASHASKVYYNHQGKSIAVYRAGRKSVTDGLNIIVAHIDSPRLDIKQNPLYEEEELALLKTHYYGGIKKYQWLSRPLSLHGVVVFTDGTSREIVIGEKDTDPVFTIADLLPHLAGKAQMTKKASEFIPGEKLNIICGSRPFTDDKKFEDRFKLNVMAILNEKYGLKEDDFISADFEIVPAGSAREVGFDTGLIAGYGQDDRVCAYTALKAIIDQETPDIPALVLLMDKEEIGSEGSTGSNTWFLEMVMGEVLDKNGLDQYQTLRRLLASADCLSADVNAAVHPDWKDVHDKRNASYLNAGLVISKFTGARGKSGSNEAHAEFIGRLRKTFLDNDIVWHTAELGKVDEGGGGTIAKFMAYYGMDVIDAGVPVLDMHSPFEITSKADIWMAYKAFLAFLS